MSEARQLVCPAQGVKHRRHHIHSASLIIDGQLQAFAKPL